MKQQYYFDFLKQKRRITYNCSDYEIMPCNQYAHNILMNIWPKWESLGVLLTGKSKRCGKSHLGSMWAEKTNAIIVCLENIEYVVDNFNIIEEKSAILIDSVSEMREKQQLLLHLYNYIVEIGAYSLWIVDSTEEIDMLQIKDLSSRIKLLYLLEIQNPDDNMMKVLLNRHLNNFGLSISNKLIEYILKRTSRSFEDIEKISNKINHLVSISGHNPSLCELEQIL